VVTGIKSVFSAAWSQLAKQRIKGATFILRQQSREDFKQYNVNNFLCHRDLDIRTALVEMALQDLH